MDNATAAKLQRGDVLRARRMGNKSRANYVIDRVVEITTDLLLVEAHREYNGGNGQFMAIRRRDAYVIRSYA